MGTTPNLGLHTTAITETEKTFLQYRTEMAGTDSDSNMNKIDAAIGQIQQSVVSYEMPEKYGAYGDGTHDDSDAIIAAINAAGVGGAVALDGGKKYRLTKTLTMLNKQTFEGNGATIIWEGPPEMMEDGITIKNAPMIFDVTGYLGDTTIDIVEKPVCIEGPSSGSYGSNNKQGFTYIKVRQYPDVETGDRIMIQAARPAMQQESGSYWCGTSTGSGTQTYWAEILVVNDVSSKQVGTDTSGNPIYEYTIRCVGSLTYPYYEAGRINGVDISAKLTEVRNPNYVDAYGNTVNRLMGYAWEKNAQKHARNCSTIRKVNFKKNIAIRNLKVDAKGITHSGSTAANVSGAYKIISAGNTIRLTLCENSVIENVSMVLEDAGRGFMLCNCWRSSFKDCSYEVNYQLYATAETHTYTNAFTFSSCWYCSADNCTTLRAGQSFDTSYGAGPVKCPPIFTEVKNCTVEEAMDSSATNHSGAFGQLFENCRFINCSRPVCIRSPLTRIVNCTFSGLGGTSDVQDFPGYITTRDINHLQFAEPTIFGCSVEGCTFVGGLAIVIAPYVNRFFNYNYFKSSHFVVDEDTEELTEVNSSYLPIGEKVGGYFTTTATAEYPPGPDQKYLGITIKNNTFYGCNGALWVKTPTRWNQDQSGNYTEYAAKDMGIEFKDNTLLHCGAHYFPIYLGHGTNGTIITGNAFNDCKSSDPSYYNTNGVGTTATRLIWMSGWSVRASIQNNTVSRCGGGYRYLTTVPTSVPEWLGTGGRPEHTITGNRISSDNDVTIYATNGTEDKHIEYAQDNRGIIVRGINGGTSGLTTGYRYDYSTGDFDVLAEGDPLISVSKDSVWHSGSATIPACFVRSWFYIYPNRISKVRWRTAVYAGEMDEDTFKRLCTCWDNGVDETGAAVTFSSSVKLDDGYDETDTETGETTHIARTRTVAAPVNAALDFLDFSSTSYRYIGEPGGACTVNKTTGVIEVDIPKASAPSARQTCLAFHAIPDGVSTTSKVTYTICTELKYVNLEEPLRINAQSTAWPGMFSDTIRTSETYMAEKMNVPGKIYMGRVRNSNSGLLDLGTSNSPWKDVYAQTLNLGNVQLTSAQLSRLIQLLN